MNVVLTAVGDGDCSRTVTCDSIDEAKDMLRQEFRDTRDRVGHCVAAYASLPGKDRRTECFMRINDDGSENFWSCYEE